MAFDLDGIRRSNRLSDVAARFGVKLERDGREFKACCPLHREDTPSFTIYPGKDGIERFTCFGCGEKGDVLDFTMRIKGVDLPSAARILGGEDGVPDNRPAKIVEARDPYDGYSPVAFERHPFVVGTEVALWNPKRDTLSGFTPTHVHEYRDETGRCYALVLRRLLPDGRKETPAVNRVRRPDGSVVWSRFPIREPKLYGLERVASAKQVIVVEGEKCADVWNRISGRCAVSWPSGGQAWSRVDWSPLAGKDVILWADHDEPGSKTMAALGRHLADLGCAVRIIDTFAAGLDFESGYDCADVFDAGGASALSAFVKEHISPFVDENDEPPPPPPSPPPPPPQTTTQMITQTSTVVNLQTRQEFLGEEGWRSQIIMKTGSKSGRVPDPKAIENIRVYTKFHEQLKGCFVYDDAVGDILVMRATPWDARGQTFPRAFRDSDYIKLLGFLERQEIRPTLQNVRHSLVSVAEENRINSLQNELNGLKWDRTERVRFLFSRYLGTPDDLYHQIVATRFLVQCVRRAMEPGCKAELMLILEGEQSAGKSTFCAILGGRWFTDQLKSVEGKDAVMTIAGKWIVEVAEMVASTRADVAAQKAWLSTQVDRYRPPYGASVVDRPRQCVFIGTHNPDGTGYLRDTTGSRRFLPVTVKGLDRQAFIRDRDQIIAEAVEMWRDGVESWVLDHESDVTRAEQSSRTARDPWLPYLAEAAKGRQAVPINDLVMSIGVPRDRLNAVVMDRVSRIMHQLGLEQHFDGNEIVFRRALKS